MMRKFLLLFACLFAFSNVWAQQEEVATWEFDSITNTDDRQLFQIQKDRDTLKLENNQFYYSLFAKDTLVASGDYLLNNDLLVFFYKEPTDTIRRYHMKTLNDSVMAFSENGVTYKFTKKKKPQASLVLDNNQGVGFNMNSFGRGVLGMFFLLCVSYLLSSNRKRINWRLVLSGLSLQLIFGILLAL